MKGAMGFICRYGCAFVFLLAVLLAGTAANAANIVSAPYVDKSVLTVTWRGDVMLDNQNKAQDGAWKQRVLVGYGFTDWLSLAVGGLEDRTGGQTPSLDGLEVQGKIQLTPRSEYWVDSGILFDYKKNIVGGTDNAAVKLLLAKTLGDFEHRVNFTAQHDVGPGSGRSIATGILWSSRYRYTEGLQPGFEIQTQFGTPNSTLSFSSQSSQAGPVLYGCFGGGFKYEVGYLFGLSTTAPNGNLKAQLGYEVHF